MAICRSESKFHLVHFATLFAYLFGGGGGVPIGTSQLQKSVIVALLKNTKFVRNQ
jgi:hypothetical protein